MITVIVLVSLIAPAGLCVAEYRTITQSEIIDIGLDPRLNTTKTINLAESFNSSWDEAWEAFVGNDTAGWSQGNGTEGNPYQIATEQHLIDIADDPDANYTIITDITLSEEWTPIPIFSGYINGNSNTITGMIINSDSNYAGFTQHLTGRIHNITFDEVYINAIRYVGTITGVIDPVYDYNFTQLLNCHSQGTINTSKGYVGGLVGAGWDYTTVINCSASVNIIVEDGYYVGGIIGELMNGKLSGCKTTGSIYEGAITGVDYIVYAGGIVGDIWENVDNNIITNCYSWMEIHAFNNVGGITGGVIDSAPAIDYCYATGLIEAVEHPPPAPGVDPDNFGGAIGQSSYIMAPVTICYDNQTTGYDAENISIKGHSYNTETMQTQNTYTNMGWDFDNWWYMPPNSYPILRWELEQPHRPVSGRYIGAMLPESIARHNISGNEITVTSLLSVKASDVTAGASEFWIRTPIAYTEGQSIQVRIWVATVPFDIDVNSGGAPIGCQQRLIWDWNYTINNNRTSFIAYNRSFFRVSAPLYPDRQYVVSFTGGNITSYVDLYWTICDLWSDLRYASWIIADDNTTSITADPGISILVSKTMGSGITGQNLYAAPGAEDNIYIEWDAELRPQYKRFG